MISIIISRKLFPFLIPGLSCNTEEKELKSILICTCRILPQMARMVTDEKYIFCVNLCNMWLFTSLCIFASHLKMKDRFSNDINIRNKQASFNFELLEKFIAGIMLKGTEIKSIREGKVTLQDG